MATIDVSSEIRAQLEADAARESRSVEDLVNQLLRAYLRDRQRQKIARETEAYDSLHPALVADHLGRWVAIHGEQLVDSDGDLAALHARIRAQYGRTAVLIRQVERTPERELRAGSPRNSVRPG